MDSDRIVELLEGVVSRLDDLQGDLDRLSLEVSQVRIQGDELSDQIESVKRAVEGIDPIL